MEKTMTQFKTARLFVEETETSCDFASIQFEEGEDPVEKYLATRKAANESPMLNRPMPKSVKLNEVL